MDIAISFPSEGCIRVRSRFLFADPEGLHCRRFIERVLSGNTVSSVVIKGGGPFPSSSTAEIRYCPRSHSRQEVVATLQARLLADHEPGKRFARQRQDQGGRGPGREGWQSLAPQRQAHCAGDAPANGTRTKNGNGYSSPPGALDGTLRYGRAVPEPGIQERNRGSDFDRLLSSTARLPLLALLQGRPRPQSENGQRQVVGAGWDVLHESAGRLRLQNERLIRRREVCQAIERELMSVLGIDNYKTSALTGSVLILYDTKQLSMAQLVEILDRRSRSGGAGK